MLIEELIFIVIAFVLFAMIFLKMIKANDTSYVAILIIIAIGILINFIEVLSGMKLVVLVKIIKYLFAIVLPLAIIILEKNGKSFLEFKNITKARIYLLFGNNKSAKNILTNFVKKYPQSYAGHRLLAEIYRKEGGMRKAIDEYVNAIDINKKDYDSYYEVAHLLTEFGKKEEATQMLKNLLQKKPEYTKGAELLGDILIEKGDYKEAANLYIEALKYNPTSYNLNYSLGIAYTMLNDFQSAKEYYEKAAELNSLAYNSKYSLAEIALIYKELEEAEKHFMEVLEAENGELEADAYFELARINMIKGEKEKAINYANIAMEIDPKKITPKIENDTLFIPVYAKLKIPFNLDEIEEKKNTKLSKKELEAKEHLEQMVDITRNLSHNDIQFLKKNRENKKRMDFSKENGEYHKERE